MAKGPEGVKEPSFTSATPLLTLPLPSAENWPTVEMIEGVLPAKEMPEKLKTYFPETAFAEKSAGVCRFRLPLVEAAPSVCTRKPLAFDLRQKLSCSEPPPATRRPMTPLPLARS